MDINKESHPGVIIGILPGVGATTASILAYNQKYAFQTARKFGTGVIEGVVAPEVANNAAVGGAFVPLLSLVFQVAPQQH